MSLMHLPAELLQRLFRDLGTEREMLALIRVNRRLSVIGLPMLYQHNITYSGSSAMVWCAERGNQTVARRILAFNPDINTPHEADLSPLRLAIDGGHAGMVQLLLNHGASAHGTLLLHRAALRGSKDVVQMLLRAGADVNSLDQYGHTPLNDAAKYADRELVQLLLDHGADLHQAEQAPTGVTPLHMATDRDAPDPELLGLLLDNGANIHATDNSRETALHWAASRPFPYPLELLLARGASVDPQNTRGETPLHCAAMAGMDANMQILQSYGADANIVNHGGLSPQQVYGELQGWSEEDLPRIG